jgi:hypothetical protein
MVLPPPMAPASTPLARPSRSSACLTAPTTPAISSHQGSYRLTTSLWSPLTIFPPCSCPPPPVGGSTMPPTILKQPSEHSPCRSVTFRSMGEEYTPTARPTMPSEGAPQTGSPSSLAQPSLPARATTHLSLSNCPPPPPPTRWGGRSLTNTLLTVGESASLVARHALDQQLRRFAYTMSYLGFANTNPRMVDALNAVALELQCWY